MFSRFVQNFRIFSKNLPVRGFYKIERGEGSPRSAASRQLSPLWLNNIDLQLQNRQNWYFWYKFVPKGYIPLSEFYVEEVMPAPGNGTLTPNLTILAFKMWALIDNF